MNFYLVNMQLIYHKTNVHNILICSPKFRNHVRYLHKTNWKYWENKYYCSAMLIFAKMKLNKFLNEAAFLWDFFLEICSLPRASLSPNFMNKWARNLKNISVVQCLLQAYQVLNLPTLSILLYLLLGKIKPNNTLNRNAFMCDFFLAST